MQQQVFYPRVHRLRMKQLEDGLDISQLRLENCGLATIHFTHHISKLFEGKTESYRVRACRTCIKLTIPLDLGQYADLESAMLVNDAHEILQGRTTQLHILVPEDIAYFHIMTVRKRGGVKDIPIMVALEERAKKNNANPRLNLSATSAAQLTIPNFSALPTQFYFARVDGNTVNAQEYAYGASPSSDMHIDAQNQYDFASESGSEDNRAASDSDMSQTLEIFETLSDEDLNLFKTGSGLFEFSDKLQSMDYCLPVSDPDQRTFDELFSW